MSDLFAAPSPALNGVAEFSATDDLEFTCPRCGLSAHETFYGPCSACVDELRTNIGLERKDVDVADYVPKMNVTPNAVASKE